MRGGVSAVRGHVTRKMLGLIPAFDCSQLLRLCPPHCKPFVCPIPTPAPRVDCPQRIMAGKTQARLNRPPRRYQNATGPDRTGPQLRKRSSSVRNIANLSDDMENTCCPGHRGSRHGYDAFRSNYYWRRFFLLLYLKRVMFYVMSSLQRLTSK